MKRQSQQSHLALEDDLIADVQEWLRKKRAFLEDLDCSSLFHNKQAAASVIRLFKVERSSQTGGHQLKADRNWGRTRVCGLNAAASNNQKTSHHPNNPAGTIYLSFSHKKEPANQ
jgi:hypothetical protein